MCIGSMSMSTTSISSWCIERIEPIEPNKFAHCAFWTFYALYMLYTIWKKHARDIFSVLLLWLKTIFRIFIFFVYLFIYIQRNLFFLTWFVWYRRYGQNCMKEGEENTRGKKINFRCSRGWHSSVWVGWKLK